MIEQPWSVIEGSAMAVTGARLLGWGRARYALLILPLMYGDTAQQRAAAKAYESLATSMREHPDLVNEAARNVKWSAGSATLAKNEVTAYADDAADKAASPQGTAETLNVTADVYDVLGKAVFGIGAGILTAGVLRTISQVNPFTRAVGEVAATVFGRRADQQAAAMAAEAKGFLSSGQSVLARVGERLATVSTGKKVMGGAAVVGAEAMGQQAVASHLTGTSLDSTQVKTSGQAQLPQI